MNISTKSPFPGIETDEFQWSKRERATLAEAARLLSQAREMVGTETDLGVDLGKGEVVLNDWLDGAALAERVGTLTL